MTSPQGPAREELERWHFLDARPKAIAYRGVKLEFASPMDAGIGKVVLNALEAERDAYRQALESLFQNGGIGVDGSGHIFLVDEDALVNELVNTAEALALSSAGRETNT